VNRTKDALQAAKARGTQLGNPRLAKALPLAVEANMEAAERFAANVVPIIKQIQASGVGSLRGVARALTALLTSLRTLIWNRVFRAEQPTNADSVFSCDSTRPQLTALDVRLMFLLRNNCSGQET
jgi:DNA invertase Pin-like site-specific DNA recombinase